MGLPYLKSFRGAHLKSRLPSMAFWAPPKPHQPLSRTLSVLRSGPALPTPNASHSPEVLEHLCLCLPAFHAPAQPPGLLPLLLECLLLPPPPSPVRTTQSPPAPNAVFSPSSQLLSACLSVSLVYSFSQTQTEHLLPAKHCSWGWDKR